MPPPASQGLGRMVGGKRHSLGTTTWDTGWGVQRKHPQSPTPASSLRRELLPGSLSRSRAVGQITLGGAWLRCSGGPSLVRF